MAVIESFPPVYSPACRALVLGTAPSVASLAVGGHYGHKRNAFWPLLHALWGARDPGDFPARYAFMLNHRIALWDVLAGCEREGSLDSAIRSPVPNDIEGLLRICPDIRAVFLNGSAAYTLFRRYFPGLQGIKLPSTSPAAASLTFQQKLDAWQTLKQSLKEA